MKVFGFHDVSFTAKDTGEVIKYTEVYLVGQADVGRGEVGAHVEVVRITEANQKLTNTDIRKFYEEKLDCIPMFNSRGKCQGLMKV